MPKAKNSGVQPRKWYRALDIARYFIYKADDDTDADRITNLQLQKLIYYAQGIHLAMYGCPIFKDQIKAWNYGPVVPRVYRLYRKHKANGIPRERSFNPNNVDEALRDFLDEI